MFAAWKLEGRPDRERYEKAYRCEVLVEDGETPREVAADIAQNRTAIGTCVWDGSLVAAHWLGMAAQVGRLIDGKRVIDIGAGTGILGVLAVKMGASRAVVTDLDLCLPVIRENIAGNDISGKAMAATLDLSKAPNVEVWRGAFDTILIGEVMYLSELSEGIARWCDYLAAPTGCSVVMAWGRNARAEPGVLDHLRAKGFETNVIPLT
ncbi:Protein-lysine methyltransferase METTL21E [Hondaea fermentalgiana]|uniref:Protein-lysine methyltransferase METTL21E n=1 Tax=Hondaea fermentalgiana TaxID=2315210 RepID=A0A2R5GT25_9STRA|nr:Protein-lysine methyltransferase METTL21E [Hondaea fermentalgiana]|eukprot:GBG34012.1 Protein-lysine methyltransferase METTL21E [Hondaea fermentalgiana]